MKRILVTGAAGQIGTELVPALRDRYGAENVVAARHTTPLHDDVRGSGPCTMVDVTDYDQVDGAIRQYTIDTVYHLSSILSATAETRRQAAHEVNINGLYNVFEAGVNHRLERVLVPSSIGAFGPETPHQKTPNDTIQKPNALYGISKVYAELLGNYYYSKLGLDVRGARLPGIISWKTPPTGGHYRLLRRYILWRNQGAALHLLSIPRHLPSNDVYAGLHKVNHRPGRGRCNQAATSRRL